MTRTDWLASTDLQAMAAFLGPAWSERMQAAFAEACNGMANIQNWGYAPIATSADWWPNGGGLQNHICTHITEPVRAALIRELAGDPYDDSLKWHDGKLLMLVGENKVQGRQFRGHISPATYRELGYEPVQWLSWHGGTVSNMARLIRDRQAWDEMPLLADALEDAGCHVEPLLMHLRGMEPCEVNYGRGFHRQPASYLPGPVECFAWRCDICNGTEWRPLRCPHVRGCWALRLLAGG